MIAVRDDGMERKAVSVDLPPVAEIDRRPSVIVVVGDAVSEPGVGVEVERLV